MIGAAPSAHAATAVGQTVPTQSVMGETIDNFYAARNNRPLWFDTFGHADASPELLIGMLRTAYADGLDPGRYRLRELEQAVRAARSGNPKDVVRADRMLSQVLVAFVRDLKHTPKVEMVWVDPELRPVAPSPRRLLDSAAAAPSLETYLARMQWMNPIYAGLREALVNGGPTTDQRRALLQLNLERARALPAANGKYVVVNVAAAQLTMHENGTTVDSMRVVVGKPVHATPMMAALIRYTSLNPYWNVPADLAAERIAPNVIKDGPSYLIAKGYELLSSWDDSATVISPASIDWASVASGRAQVRLRQLPGPSNAMGRMKFMFPNAQGIYLHDTPEKYLLVEEARMFSGGCVRLEDAPRLAQWLYRGQPPKATSSLPEQRVDLPSPVPVYLTYLTAIPDGVGVAFLPDVYDRDRAALAALGDNNFASR